MARLNALEMDNYNGTIDSTLLENQHGVDDDVDDEYICELSDANTSSDSNDDDEDYSGNKKSSNKKKDKRKKDKKQK